MRDAFESRLGKDVGLDVKAYRPIVVFINGAYWGIYAFREKFNAEYLVNHYGVDPDSVDLIEKVYQSPDYPSHSHVQAGDIEHYNAMLDFIAQNDMSDAANYEYVKTKMNVENFITYCVAKIYMCDYDFNSNNVRWWRPRTPDGRWEWLLYDGDRTFGSRSSTVYSKNMLNTAVNSILGREILSKLLINNSFKYDFINHMADYINSAFLPDRVIQRLRELKEAIEPEMERHIARWDVVYKEGTIGSMENWYDDLKGMETFAEERPYFARSHLMSRFGLSGTANVELNVSQPNVGKIKLNILTLESFPWNGIYFKDVPIQLTALPHLGYRFAGWSGVSAADTSSITITLTDDVSVIANFEKDTGASNTIVINEINYNSSIDIDPEDWVEFYNPLDSPVDISGWIFKDSNDTNEFVFPDNTIITPYGYLVLCNDTAAFHTVFPDVDNYIGDLAFNLSNASELIRLYNSESSIVDSLTYDDSVPWPVEPDGTGYTLALQDPNSDNSLPENWTYSSNYGTPGVVNDWVSGVDEIEIPIAFSLGQNYPNPFNPSTTIPFSIPRSGMVTIEIYSILGQRVKVILDEYMSAGYHSIVFKVDDLANGIYFYTIKASGFKKSKSMLLLK